MKKLAYLASPFGFSESQKLFMDQVYVPALRRVVEVVNPWDLTTQNEIDEAVRSGSQAEFRHEIGRRNAQAIMRADIVVAALDGQELDSGTVVEIGFAAGLGKKIYAIRSDFRQSGELQAAFNIQVEYFINASGGSVFKTLDSLVRILGEESQYTQPSSSANLESVANFLFEVGMLAQSPRSFTSFLGSGHQSIAEHINRTTYVGFTLGTLEGSVDVGKIVQMCLLHDLAESRTGDLNYVNQKYAESDEQKVIDELTATLSFGDDIQELLGEYKASGTKESLLARDADQLEFILTLKEQLDVGNARASTWIPSAVKRLKTPVAQKLVEKILTTPSDEWWFGNKDDDWWVSRSGVNRDKRF